MGVGRSRPRSWPRSSAAGSPTSPFVGPTLAAELRRLAAGARRPRGETVVLDAHLGGLAVADADRAGRAVVHRRRRVRTALLVLARRRFARRGRSLDARRIERRPHSSVASGRAAVPRPIDATIDAVATRRRRADAWSALGLALDLRRSRRRDARRGRARDRVRIAAACSTACRSARSRPCSTCSPTRSSRPRARAASRCTRRGRSTRSTRPTRSRPPRPPRPTAPAPPARCARPRSRCTAASATRGSASRTCTCGARWSRSTCSVASARRMTVCSRIAGSGTHDGLR